MDEHRQDPMDGAVERLDEAEAGDDQARLKVLDDLNASLENELDPESDQAGPARR